MDRSADLPAESGYAYVSELLDAAQAQTALLREVAEALRGSGAMLAVSEKAQLPHLSPDFPFPGSKRWLIPRQPQGGTLVLPAKQAVQVLPANSNRLGGYVVNPLEKPTLLLLCDQRRAASNPAGVGSILLAQEAWDLRLGPNLLWSGSVTALSSEEGELSVAEL